MKTDGRIALVTGAGLRIGRAIAVALGAQGWHVVLHYRQSRGEAETAAREIRDAGGRANLLDADLADLAAVEGLIPRCVALAGAPTCLINNASLFLDDGMGTLTAAQWQAHMDVNLRAPVFLAQAFAANLPEDAEGCIINLIDQRVLRPVPGFFSYTVSKAGLRWATTTMAQALGPRIRVNAIAPGPVLPSIHHTEAGYATERAGTLLGVGAEPEHIAAAVRFILDTPSMTGEMITLDGGQHLRFER